MVELAPEDQFRLEILLTRDLKAVRIDEVGMRLHALAADGEASLPLHPNDRPERYLRRVRETLAVYALGSPGGYPRHLSRWTRHGQISSDNLSRLLLTGEPEAVAAVVHSPALTAELAGYAWWIQPTIDNARLMLCRPAVAEAEIGAVLTAFLIEHLPFLQEDPLAVLDTVTVLIGCGCLTDEQEQGLWQKRRASHCLPFIECGRLPGQEMTPASFALAALMLLERPDTQDMVSRTLNAIGAYYRGHPEAAEALREASEALVAPIFARSTAVGSLMRQKTEPALAPVREALQAMAAG